MSTLPQPALCPPAIPLWRWLLALLAGIGAWYAAHAAGLLAALLAAGGLDAPIYGRPLPLVALGVVKMILTLVGIHAVMRLVGRDASSLGLVRRWTPGEIAAGVGVGIGIAVLQFAVLLPLTGGAQRSDVIASQAIMGDAAPGLVGAMVLGWTGGAVAEELFFRGFLITMLHQVLGGTRGALAAAVLISTAYFALGHSYQGWIGVLDVGITGLLYGLLYLWRRRLAAPILAHGALNTLLFLGLFIWY